MSTHIHTETTRCLQCKTSPCERGCPINTPIKEAIYLARENRLVDAGKLLFDNNPLSVVTGLVCPHEDFCEGHCVLSNKNNAVNIGAIEHYISEYYLNKMSFEAAIDESKKVAIVGSGPAGLTAAIILARKGYAVTIFESHDKIGGVLRFGIPEFRLPNKILDRYQEILLQLGVKIRPNTVVGPVLTLEDLFRDGYKAVFIATGTWRPRKLNVVGESLGNVFYAIDYLRNPENHILGSKVCVIGGGNVALDAARTAMRKGASDVVVFYRRGENEMPSSQNEIDYAKMDGVTFEFNRAPKRITDHCVDFVKTQIGEDGRLHEIPGTEICYDADSVIISISQGPQSNIVDSLDKEREIKIDKFGLVKIDADGKTSLEGVFASGDVVTGAKTVVEAVASAKRVSQTIDEYIKSQD